MSNYTWLKISVTSALLTVALIVAGIMFPSNNSIYEAVRIAMPVVVLQAVIYGIVAIWKGGL